MNLTMKAPKKMKKQVEEDFGFTTYFDDQDLLEQEGLSPDIDQLEITIDELWKRLKGVEELILPFLQKLYDTRDNDIIKWPDRGPVVQAQIDKLLALTREQ